MFLIGQTGRLDADERLINQVTFVRDLRWMGLLCLVKRSILSTSCVIRVGVVILQYVCGVLIRMYYKSTVLYTGGTADVR